MLSRSWARSRKSLPYRFPLARRTCNISRYSLKKSRVGELRRAEDLGNRAALVCFRVLLTCYGLAPLGAMNAGLLSGGITANDLSTPEFHLGWRRRIRYPMSQPRQYGNCAEPFVLEIHVTGLSSSLDGRLISERST